MNFSIRLFALAVLVLASPSWAAEKPLRMAVNNYFPPMSWVEDSKHIKGFDPELAMALCEIMARPCQLRAVGLGDRIPGLMLGRFDVLVSALTPNEHWARSVALSRAYAMASSVFLAPLSFDGDPDPARLKGLTIGVKDNSPHADHMEQSFGESRVETFSSVRGVFEALAAGRVDLAFVPSFPAVDFLNGPGGDGFKVVGRPVSEGRFGSSLHIAVRKGDAALLQAVNAALEQLIQDGGYDAIAERYFPAGIREAVKPPVP